MLTKSARIIRLPNTSLQNIYDDFDENIKQIKDQWSIDQTYGSLANPLKGKLSEEIKNGFGWKGHERILEDQIALLLSYTKTSHRRQIPLRVLSPNSKNRSRRADLIIFFSCKELSSISKSKRGDKSHHETNPDFPFVLTEFKSDFIDADDINTICRVNRYHEFAFAKYNISHTQPFVLQFVSPGGITEEAVQALNEQQKRIKAEFPNVIVSALTLREMVCRQLRRAIDAAYRDRNGYKIGKQHAFVNKDNINFIIHKIANPSLWLPQTIEIEKAITEDMAINFSNCTIDFPEN